MYRDVFVGEGKLRAPNGGGRTFEFNKLNRLNLGSLFAVDVKVGGPPMEQALKWNRL